MDKKAVAIDFIRKQVWTGFYNEDKVAEIVTECVFYPDVVDGEWVRTEIQREFQAKELDEISWPDTTDCDRLDDVMATLEEEGILALQNAGYEQSDGITEVVELYHAAGGAESDIAGYCFYHGQDLEHVLEDGELYVSFGDIRGDQTKGVEIGIRVKQALVDAGFLMEWDGKIKTRILIKGFKWQKRTYRDSDEDE